MPVPTLNKSTPPGPFNVPATIVSTVVAGNSGSGPLVGAVVADAVPASPAGTTRTWTAVIVGGVTGSALSGTGAISETLTIPVGATITYTITDLVIRSGPYQNTASITPVVGPPVVTTGGPVLPVGPFLGNPTLSKSTAPGPYNLPAVIISTVIVGNTGSIITTGIVVNDNLFGAPAGTTRSWTSTQTGGVTGSSGGGAGAILETIAVPPGATITYTITDTVVTAGVYRNDVEITAPFIENEITATGGPNTVGPNTEIVGPPRPAPPGDERCETPIRLCSQTGSIAVCADGVAAILVTISGSDGDVIPTTSTEFPAPAGAGVFSAMGFFRSYYTNAAGVRITPAVVTIGSCAGGGGGANPITYLMQDGISEPGCANGVPYTRTTRGTYDMLTGALVGEVQGFLDSSGIFTTVAPLGFTLGDCATITPQATTRTIATRGRIFASGIHVADWDLLGYGGIWNTVTAQVLGRLQSITITVFRSGNIPSDSNRVSVNMNGDSFFMIEGQTASWSVAQDDWLHNERLAEDIVIDCQGNSAILVTWTEEQ